MTLCSKMSFRAVAAVFGVLLLLAVTVSAASVTMQSLLRNGPLSPNAEPPVGGAAETRHLTNPQLYPFSDRPSQPTEHFNPVVIAPPLPSNDPSGSTCAKYLRVKRLVKGEAGTEKAEDVFNHLTMATTGSDNKMTLNPNGVDDFAGELANPARLMWYKDPIHTMSCWDARNPHQVLATPGGDIAEFILGLNAMERQRGIGDGFDAKQVYNIFANYIAEKHEGFYMHTTSDQFIAWKKRAGVEEPDTIEVDQDPLWDILDLAKKELIIELAPQFMNCQHIQEMRKREYDHEDGYSCRRELVDHVIRAAVRVKMDSNNPHRHRVKYRKSKGFAFEGRAFVNIMSPLTETCQYVSPGVVPLLEQDHTLRSLYVYHPKAVYVKRAYIAKFLQGEFKQTDKWMLEVFKTMCEIGNKQMHLTKAVIANIKKMEGGREVTKPVSTFEAFFSSDPPRPAPQGKAAAGRR